MAGLALRYNRSPATLDTLCTSSRLLPRQSHFILCFDGPSDLPDPEHPNLAGFSFNFANTTTPSQEISSDQRLLPPVLKARSGSESAKSESTKSRFEQSSLSHPDSVSPNTLSVSNPDRRFINFSRLSRASVPSPEVRDSSKAELGPVPRESQFAPKAESPAGSENTPPRSARRVIRPDDWWKKDTQKKPVAKEGLSSIDSLVPAPLRIRTRSLAVKKSREFLAKVQPLVSPSSPPPVPASERKATESEQLFQASSKSIEVYIEEPDEHTPRITRENILRHILSAENIRDLQRSSVSIELGAQEETGIQEALKMSMLHPESAAAMTEHRREAVRLAQTQEKSVIEKCKRSDQATPGYTFDELIGKGSYGRVYKGRQTSTSKVVAIKVLDVDEADFHAHGEAKDEQIRDFNREIRILRQAQESGAPNMNQIIEALPVHSQLWMICEYCPGGSVKTLMRATNDRLLEKYIVVVARELAKALKGLHDAGIMHRDVKAANVLVHEEGRLQLCDFGVAGVLEQRTDKRRTFIGTLHWMPPELWSDDPEYSDEVDVWEYGVTLYECALGKPPNSDLRERQQLKVRMRRLKQSIGLPEHEDFSDGLRSLVSYTLSPDAKTRPSMKDVLEHDYLRETEETHPTSSLIQLVQVYYQWLYSGGQRASLFMPGGAVVTDASDSIITPSDEWNFSTTDTFEKRNSTLLEIPSSELSPTDSFEGEATPKGSGTITLSPPTLRDMTNVQKLNFESRVKRGADLSNLFDQEKPDYEYKIKNDFRPAVEERRTSDLPFRAMAEDRPTSIASNVIDLGDFDSEDYAIAAPRKEETIQLADAATIRARRGDSKGPRDSSAALTLTARRTSSAENVPVAQDESAPVAAQDFSFPPKEWAEEKSPDGSMDLRGLTEKGSNRDASRKTMEWTFATAVPASSGDEEHEERSPVPSQVQTDKSMKHATLDWSFSNAMAEADAVPSLEDFAGNATKTTPKRPAPLLRTMTQPVTSTDFHHAEDFPRPSTAQSEAHSESSFSSADFDPFSLDEGHEHPDPSALDEMNISSFYNTRGRTIIPEHVVPYSSTVAGPAPYILGRPARIGEEGHPGPPVGVQPNLSQAKADKKKKKSTSSSSSAGGRPKVEMPEAIPPSEAAMAGDASSVVMESELSRLLGGLQQSLSGATQALGLMRRKGPKSKKGRGRRSSTEWESDE